MDFILQGIKTSPASENNEDEHENDDDDIDDGNQGENEPHGNDSGGD